MIVQISPHIYDIGPSCDSVTIYRNGAYTSWFLIMPSSIHMQHYCTNTHTCITIYSRHKNNNRTYQFPYKVGTCHTTNIIEYIEIDHPSNRYIEERIDPRDDFELDRYYFNEDGMIYAKWH